MAHMHLEFATDDRKATIAYVEFVLDNGAMWAGTGSSKRASGDVWDYELGELIAGTRALDNLLRHSSRGLEVAVRKRIKLLDRTD
jgi:hypothetical protein